MEEEKNLEVQDSVESPEVVEQSGEPVDEEFVYDEEDFDSGFVDRVDSLMNDLNLTRKHFVAFSGCVVVLVIGIILSFVFLFRVFGSEPEEVVAQPVVEEKAEKEEGGGFLSGLFGNKDKDEKEEEPKKDKKDKAEEKADVVEVEDSDKDDSTSVSASVDLGDTESVTIYDSDAIRSAIYYGSTELVDDKLSYYVRTYRKVRNIFNNDLFSFLSSVTDREAGYNSFLIQFKGANEQAKLAFEELRQDIEVFDQRLARINDELQVVENEFFEAMDKIDSERLPELLDAFQDLSNKQSIIKSEILAREAIGQKYVKALPIIESKIEAIEVNKDAFVKGVKVVEFNSVDLDLVIQESE